MSKVEKRNVIRVFLISVLSVMVIFSTTVLFSAYASDNENTPSPSDVSTEETSHDESDETIVIYEETVEGKNYRFKPNAVYNGSFRSELLSNELPIYDAMYKQCVTNKSNDPIVVDFSGRGYSLDDTDEINDMIKTAFTAFSYDHPEVFWIKSYNPSYYYTTGDQMITKLCINMVESYPSAYNDINTVNKGISNAVNVIRSSRLSAARYDTAKAIHDYICNNISYDYDVLDGGAYPGQHAEDQTVSPLFGGGRRGKKFVCEGYSESFKLLCDRFGIPCVHVISGTHAWNYMMMDNGKWYAVDVTWDDIESKPPVYTYFLIGKNTVGFNGIPFCDNHVENYYYFTSGTFNPLAYPQLSSSAYPTSVHSVDLNYPTDFIATARAKMDVFGPNHENVGNHYVDAGDVCTIHEVYTDGCCRVTYPTSSGTTTFYCYADNFQIAEQNDNILTAPIVTSSSKFYASNAEAVVSWNKVSGASSYWLVIYKDGVKILSDTVGSKTSYPVNFGDGFYEIYVQSVNRVAKKQSECYSFHIGKLDTPVVTSTERYYASGAHVTINWTECTGATKYHVSIWRADEPGMQGVPYGDGKGIDVSGTSCSFDPVDGYYGVFVNAINTNGGHQVAEAVKYNFFVGNMRAPIVDTSVQYFAENGEVTIKWNACEGATGYHISFWRADAEGLQGTPYGEGVDTDKTSYTFSPENGYYGVYVSAINTTGGYQWETAEKYNFTVGKLDTPVVDTSVQYYASGAGVTIKWSPCEGATKYHVSIWRADEQGMQGVPYGDGKGIDVNDGTSCTFAPDDGYYGVFVYAVNTHGGEQIAGAEKYNFHVGKLEKPVVTTAKKYYPKNSTVTVNWNPCEGATKYLIEVWVPDKCIINEYITDTFFTIDTEESKYGVFVYAINDNGGYQYCKSEKLNFWSTDYKLDKSFQTLTIGHGFNLSIEANAIDPYDVISWTSSNPSVATVNSSGFVNGLNIGTTVITASIGNMTASCTVDVRNKLDSYPVKINKSSLSMVITDNNPKPSSGLSAQKPRSIKKIIWCSDDPEIATVTQSGKVTALAPGIANIYCKSESGEILSLPCKVNIRLFIIDTTALLGNERAVCVNNVFCMANTDNEHLYVTDSEDTSTPISWKSSSTGIVNIDQEGFIQCHGKKGTVTITATCGSIKTSIKIRAYQPTESLQLNYTNFWIYSGKQLNMKATQSKGADEPIFWESLDSSVVSINEKGVLKGLSQGITSIRAYSASGREIRTDVLIRSKASGLVWIAVPGGMNPRSSLNYGIRVNATKDLYVKISAPVNCNDTVTWSTSNKSVVEISTTLSSGKGVRVRGLKKGTATVTAKTGSGKKVTYRISVVPEAAQQIQLNKNAVSIYTGAAVSLSAKILPKGCNDVVMWKSSNTSVATVDENGKVTAKSQGQAVVTAYSSLTETAYDTANIYVLTKATGFTWDTIPEGMTPRSAIKYAIGVNNDMDLAVKITSPVNCNDYISWSSSNRKVIEIFDEYDHNNIIRIHAYRKGTATITARTGSGKKVTYQITVMDKVNPDILFNKHSATIYKGSALALSAKVTPKGSVVLWKSSDPGVAIVDENGKVTAITNGTATITAYPGYADDSYHYDQAEIKVITKATSVSVNSTSVSLGVGYTFNAIATVAPAGCGDTLTWTSSNKAIATVTPSGEGSAVIQAFKPGKCTVTVKTGSGKTIKITVTIHS